jgi:hypothetical protein
VNETPDGEGGPAGASTLPTRADRYLAEVREHLAGLTDDERDELLDDLAAHLHEVAADDPHPLSDTLGPPERFAAELLASAGLADRARAGSAAGGAVRFARPRAWARRVRAHRWTRATTAFLPELRPAWWVARGYLVVLGLTAMFGDGDDLGAFPVPEVGTPVFGLVAVVAAIVLSVRLGRSAEASRTGVRLLDVATVVLALVALGHVRDGIEDPFTFEDPAYADPGVVLDQGMGGQVVLTSPDGSGGQVTNVYAYDRAGELIPDALLYDQDGRPIDLGDVMVDPMSGAELETAYALDANGAEVRNEFPLDQRAVEWDETGTRRVSEVRPPVVVVPPPTTTTTTTAP